MTYGKFNSQIVCNMVLNHDKLFISYPAIMLKDVRFISDDERFFIRFKNNVKACFRKNHTTLYLDNSWIESNDCCISKFINRPPIEVRFNIDGDGGISIENESEVLALTHVVSGQDVYYQISYYDKDFEREMSEVKRVVEENIIVEI